MSHLFDTFDVLVVLNRDSIEFIGDDFDFGFDFDISVSNTRLVLEEESFVVVKDGAEQIETGLKKFGAMLGDHVEVGCNSVLNPGTVIGRNSSVYPLSNVRGVVPADSIVKSGSFHIEKKL